MRILVFGQNGQVAQCLARVGGSKIVPVGREAADFENPQSCLAAIDRARPDVIINAAAYTAVDKAEEQPALAEQINATAPTIIAGEAFLRGIAFLHISTDYVFDGGGTRAWTEADTPAPINTYGRTKYQGEQAIQATATAHQNARFAILRTSWVFSDTGANFVKTMLGLARTQETLSIVGDQIGSPTSATDIAETLLTIAAALHENPNENPNHSGLYHYAGAPFVSWADFAKEIFTQANLPVKITPIPSKNYPTPATRPLNSRLDCTKIRKTFGIKPPDWRLSLPDIIAHSQQK